MLRVGWLAPLLGLLLCGQVARKAPPRPMAARCFVLSYTPSDSFAALPRYLVLLAPGDSALPSRPYVEGRAEWREGPALARLVAAGTWLRFVPDTSTRVGVAFDGGEAGLLLIGLNTRGDSVQGTVQILRRPGYGPEAERAVAGATSSCGSPMGAT